MIVVAVGTPARTPSGPDTARVGVRDAVAGLAPRRRRAPLKAEVGPTGRSPDS